MQMIFQNSIDKLSRGCGIELFKMDSGVGCGHLFEDGKRVYCRDCQAQLTQLTNLSKQVENEKKDISLDCLMDKWWEEKHKGDTRCSGDFSWDEIMEFGRFLLEELNKRLEKL